MPQQLGAPGVYVEEIPSGRRVIRSVGTNIAAFIDYFREGPLNQAVQIFGTADFERVFGGYDGLSEASFAIPQFFLNGGTQAYVIRVAAADNAHPLAAAGAVLRSTALADMLTVSAINPGAWGNTLRVEIDHEVADNGANDLRFNFRVTRFASGRGNAQGLVTESYLNLSMNPDDRRHAPTVINDGSALVSVTAADNLDGTVRPAATGTTGDDVAALTQANLDAIGANSTVAVTIEGQDRGAQTQAARLNWAAGAVTTLPQLRARLEASIRAADATDPSFAGARVTLANGQLRVLSGRSGTNYTPLERVVFADTTGTAAALMRLSAPPAFANVQHYTLGIAAGTALAAGIGLAPAPAGSDVGANGLPPTAAEIIGSAAMDPPTGMHALDRVDLFNLLCIPRAAELEDTPMDAVIANAISYCEDRRAFMIVDIPADIDRYTEMTDWVDSNAQYRSRNAAVYFPRIRVPDPTNEFRLRSIGSSGTVAGIYARTDTRRGVWKAPAGIETLLEGVSELAAPLSDAQNGVLNPLGINALRTFPVYGTIAWGARTLAGADALASEWAYVPVRRLALMLEESLFRGTKWAVFEPNDEPTWANIRLNIGAFMNGLFRQGAFAGATPRAAYYVKCDSETTTQNDIDQGIVNIEVGFAPLKPAEFVVIRFRQIVGEVDV